VVTGQGNAGQEGGRATPAPTIGYTLLGLLALRSWTGYELAAQVRSTLRLVWPSSEAHVYREQRRLVERGWADVTSEPAGRRNRNRYVITDAGRAALRGWLATPPKPPSLEVETLVRLWLADQGTPEDLVAALRSTASAARGSVADAAALAGPSSAGQGQFPERSHLNALVGEMLTDVLLVIAQHCERAITEVGGWDTTVGHGLDDVTRARLKRVVEAARPDC
jgi:DNA-binding PadR family transcriptional regulator